MFRKLYTSSHTFLNLNSLLYIWTSLEPAKLGGVVAVMIEEGKSS